jgi:hypothetical protein
LKARPARLRPRAESLHEWVERHDRQHAKPEPDGDAVEAQQHGKADQAERDHEEESALHAHLSARDRPGARPRYLRVDIAIDVVISAAGGAHDECADRKEEQELGSGIRFV